MSDHAPKKPLLIKISLKTNFILTQSIKYTKKWWFLIHSLLDKDTNVSHLFPRSIDFITHLTQPIARPWIHP